MVFGVEGGTYLFVVALAVFVPGVKGPIHERLAQTVPEEAGTAVTPVVVLPTPETKLGEVGDTSRRILGPHVGEKIKVLLGNRPSESWVDEVAGKSGRHKEDERKGDGKKSEVVSETGVEKGKKVKKEDGADTKEKGVGQREGDRELGKRSAEKLTDKGDLVVYQKASTKKEEKTKGKDTHKRLSPGKLLFEGVVKAGKNKGKREKAQEIDDGNVQMTAPDGEKVGVFIVLTKIEITEKVASHESRVLEGGVLKISGVGLGRGEEVVFGFCGNVTVGENKKSNWEEPEKVWQNKAE